MAGIVSNTQNSAEATTKVLTPIIGTANPYGSPGQVGFYVGDVNTSTPAPRN